MGIGRKRSRSAGAGFTLLELVIVVLIVGVLAAIAIPNFTKLQARAKRSEVKSALKSAYVAQQAFWQQHDRYAENTVLAGFTVERGNRYAYVFADACPIRETRATVTSAPTPGQSCIDVDTFRHVSNVPDPATAVTEFVTQTAFLLGAAGNVDNDLGLDQWSIASVSRTAGVTSSDTTCASGPAPAGEPCEDQADL